MEAAAGKENRHGESMRGKAMFRQIKSIIIALDLVFLACTVYIVGLTGKATLPAVFEKQSGVIFGVISIGYFSWFLISEFARLNSNERQSPVSLLVRLVAAGFVLGIIASAIAFFLGSLLPRSVVGLFVGIFCLLCASSRILIAIASSSRPLPKGVVLGTGRVARELAVRLAKREGMLCEVVGFLAPEATAYESIFADDKAPIAESMPVLDISQFLAQRGIERLFIVLEDASNAEVQKLAAQCRQAGIIVAFVPQEYELYVSRAVLVDVGGIPVLEMNSESTMAPHSKALKRIEDIVIAMPLSVISFPVILIAALYLKWINGRGFHNEKRCGIQGDVFDMWRLNANSTKQKVSRGERFIAESAISDLPQLWNVLQGQMSLVGPRPESPERVQIYTEWQQQRLFYVPGMVGIAQNNGMRERNSSDEKTKYDLQYPLRFCPLTDITLILECLALIARRLVAPRTRVVSAIPPLNEGNDYPIAEFIDVNSSKPSSD
jgi:lipopolysaccharide/colanic/teichoic acid biosynthesis glycosyltransferase